MKAFNCSILVSILVTSTIFFSKGYSQSINDLPLTPSPYDVSYFREALELSTIRANTSESIDQIPKAILYRQIFLGILRNPSLLYSFSPSDIEIIQNLPSHESPEFINPQRLEHSNLCLMNDEQKANRGADIVSISKLYESSRRRAEIDLENHYETVLSTLSLDGQEIVDAEIEGFTKTRNLTYSTLDMEKVGLLLPEIAKRIITNMCDELLFSEYVEEDSLLKDENVIGVPFNRHKD